MSEDRVPASEPAPESAPESAPGSARALALRALARVDDGAFSHVAVPALLAGSRLAPRDRAFVTDLVYGVLRERRRLDAILQPLLTRRLADLDRPVRDALRLGVYQLEHGVAPHAAVGETVAVAPRRARGLVNAVLRRAAVSGPPWPEPDEAAVALSYPDWLVDRLVADLGPADARAVLEAGNRPAALTLRPNRLRTTPERLATELRAAGAEVTVGELVPDALLVRGAGDPGRLPAVAEGRATPQDQGSQAVVDLLGLGAGDRLLDVAAGPGGKATAAAERVGPTGAVVALDVHAGRLRLVATAARRLGLANVLTVQADGLALPVRPGAFARVLVDAPCTGLGVLRRRPEARWRAEPAAVERLAGLQRAILEAAAAAVAPGGRLVYSVCTLTAAETVGVADAVGARLGGFTAAEPPGPPWRRWGTGALLLPQVAETDGMYVAVWTRGR